MIDTKTDTKTDTDRSGIKSPEKRPVWRSLLLAFIIVAAGEFVVRGPYRELRQSNDLAAPYIGAMAWREGSNPYNADNLNRLWQVAQGTKESRPVRNTLYYPPSTFILLSPLSLLSWPVARVVMTLINVVLVLGMIASLIRTWGLEVTNWRTGLFVGLSLGLAPIHTGMGVGNLIVPAAACVAFAVWSSVHRRDIVAGIFLGVATALKPQIGGLAVIAYVVQRRWWIAITAALVTGLLLGTAIVQMQINHVPWLHDWLANNAALVNAGDAAASHDVTVNSSRHQLLNLQWVFNTFIQQTWLVNLIVVLAVGILAASYVALHRGWKPGINDVLSLGTLIVIGLLPLYHRSYDAMLLVIPLSWAVASLEGSQRLIAWLLILLMVPFLVPGPVMLQQLIAKGRLPASLNDEFWWSAIVLAHEVWTVVLMSLLLVYALAKTVRQPSPVILPIADRAHA
jgi:hypothetical protein